MVGFPSALASASARPSPPAPRGETNGVPAAQSATRLSRTRDGAPTDEPDVGAVACRGPQPARLDRESVGVHRFQNQLRTFSRSEGGAESPHDRQRILAFEDTEVVEAEQEEEAWGEPECGAVDVGDVA